MSKMAFNNFVSGKFVSAYQCIARTITFVLLYLGLCISAGAQVDIPQELPDILRTDDERLNSLPPTTEQIRSWHQAVDDLIIISERTEQAPNASYKFNACFLKDGECVAHSQAYRDEFRKLTYYYALSKRSVPQNHVSFYLSLKDENVPKLVMRFTYVGQEWIYINEVAILVDGEIIFQRSIPADHIERQAVSGSLLYEFGDLLMNENLDVVERIENAKTVAVRISGSSGEAYLDELRLVNMQLQAEEIRLMYELLRNAIEGAATSAMV